ncbi:MAG: hypothetical protein QMC89_02600 [Candidatus Hodarchaeaceae archaeon]|nr:hypothetical protein [Candidatus Hodarchaeaceae archaeon]
MSTRIRTFGQREWDLIRARIEAMPPHLKPSIGGVGEFDKERLLKEIDERTEIGELIVKIYFNYFRSFKKEAALIA